MPKRVKKGFYVLSISAMLANVAYSAFLVNQIEEHFDINGPKTHDIPVAYIVGKEDVKYTTIERALEVATNGDIVCLVPPTKDNYHVKNNQVKPDIVTYEVTRNCEIKEGVTLVIPTDQASANSVASGSIDAYLDSLRKDDGSKGNASEAVKYASESNYLRVTLVIKNGVQLVNRGTLVVSGNLSAGNGSASMIGHTAFSYSRIVMEDNSTIIQDTANAKSYVFGYIEEQQKDNGSAFNVLDGVLEIPMVVNDYRGFSLSWAMSDGALSEKRCSPFNQYELKNVQCKVKLSKAVSVLGDINFYVKYDNLDVNEYFYKQIGLVGSDDSFLLNANTTDSSSIVYKFDKEKETALLQLIGGYSLNPLSLSLKASGLTVDLSTDKSFFPISYRLNIELISPTENETTFDFTKQRLKLLPGVKFTIGQGCKVKAKELVIYSAFYDGTLGDGESSKNAYTSVKYPVLKGAELIVNGTIDAECLAGTCYSDDNKRIVYQNDTIESYEAWNYKASGKLTPAWTVDDYLVIRERLQIVPLEYLSHKRFFVGLNTFANYKQYLPCVGVVDVQSQQTFEIADYQSVLFFSDINTFRLELRKNIYKIYNGAEFYQKDFEVNYTTDATICCINSRISISSSTETGVNEFVAQSVSVKCVTPTIEGEIPLFVNGSVQMQADVIDIDKIYDKKINWSSSNEAVATVDENGKVTGVSLGEVTIYAKCNGVIGSMLLNVIERKNIQSIETITISDNKGNSATFSKSEEDKTSDFNANNKYGNNQNITFTLQLNEGAHWSSIEWKLHASQTGRQYIDDSTKQDNIIANCDSIDIHTGSGTGASDDSFTLAITITDQKDGTVFKITLNLIHKADTTCLLPKARVLMADGSWKEAQYLQTGDDVIAFDHYTGKYIGTKLLVNAHKNDEEKKCRIIELVFSTDIRFQIVQEHGFFDLNTNRYEFINADNCKAYIGHSFALYDGKEESEATLISYQVYYLKTKYYSPASVWHLNLVVDKFLSISSGMTNLYEIGEGKKYNVESMKRDIGTYGTYSYETFAPYISKEVYKAFPFKYLKRAVARGEITFSWILKLIEYYKSAS